MQTTLLGLAIAFILALLAALIGPYFIDWTRFRPQFEVEASRVLGTPVRVGGTLDARLLPAPSLRLRDVTVGGAHDLGKVRADKLDVEFSLSALMRGEIRATELTINGAAVDIGLDPKGRIDWPASSGGYNLGALAIERVNLTGRIALHHAASRGTIELNDVVFSGDVRALAGAIRGNGNFTLSGTRYPFRLSSSQTADQSGTRVRLNVDSVERALALDLDGLLTFEARSPRFDGTLTAGSSAPVKSDNDPARNPWRVVTKFAADSAAATLDQIDVGIGADDSALKLAGSGDVKFGAAPLLRAAVAAKSIDADRTFGASTTNPAKLLAGLADLAATFPQPGLPAQVGVSAEQIMLGGRPLQNLAAELRSDGQLWAIDRLELRAPGATRVALTRPTRSSRTGGFDGALDLESADAGIFAAWLRGAGDPVPREPRSLRLRGTLALAPNRIAIDGMTLESDGSAVKGNVAFATPDKAPSRLDAKITGDRLDIDAAGALLRALSGSQTGWPDEAQIAIDVGRAVSAGQTMQPFAIALGYGADRIALDRFRIGEASGVALDGSGSFDRKAATGRLALNATAPSMKGITDLLAPAVPQLADRLKSVSGGAGAVKIGLALDVDRNGAPSDRTKARAVLTIDAPEIKGTTTLSAMPSVLALRGFDLDALRKNEATLETKLSSPRGHALLALAGLDQAIAAGDGPLQCDGSVTGLWQGALRLSAKLSGAGLDADAQGTAEPWSEPRKAAIKLAIRRADLAPLLGLKPGDPTLQAVSLSSRVTVTGDKIALGDMDGVIAGARLRGNLALTLGDTTGIAGDIGLDRIDIAPALGFAIGSAGRDASEPLGRGALQNWRGQVSFQALRGLLPGGVELRQLGGVIKGNGQSLTVTGIKGSLGNGNVTADIDARTGLLGLALNAQVQMTDVDGTALRYRALAMPAARTALKMTLSAQGRSASALSGGLSGDGLLTLSNARIAGLDPAAFDAAVRASDAGQATDDDKLRQVVEPVLAAGALVVPTAQIPFTIKDGRLRVGATALDNERARAIVSGGYDITADQADIRAVLTPATTTGPSGIRPDIQVFAVGTPDGLNRSIDVASLSAWLTLRTIDRETRRLDALDPARPASAPDSIVRQTPAAVSPTAIPPAEVPIPRRPPPRPRITTPITAPPQAAAAPPHVGPQVAPLPPAIDVRPAPGGPPRVVRPRPPPPLVLTPQPQPSSPRAAF